MTERRPPPSPPRGPPPLDAYRPRSELPPAPQQMRPPQQYPPRPLPAGAQRPRPDSRSGQRGHRSPKVDSGWGIAAYVGFALLGVLLIAAAGIGYLVVNPPVELIRREVIAEVKAKTGRDLKIGGATRFTIYPSIGVTMEQVELSPPPGMSGRPLVAMASLDINVGLMPLIRRRIEVDRLVLRAPVIELRTDKAGRKSWDLRRAANASERVGHRIEVAQATPANRATDAPVPGAASPPGAFAGIEHLSLRDVRIENGTLVWHDERAGTRETISSINVETGLTSLAQPLAVKGNFVARGEKLDVTGSLGTVQAVIEGRPAKVSLKVHNAVANLGFDGTLAANLDADGRLNLTSGNVRGLAALMGADLGPGPGFGPASLEGRLTTAGGRVAIDDARIKLDGMAATGSLGLDAGGARPRLMANLDAGALDLNPYLVPREGAASRAHSSGRAPAASAPPAADGAPNSIDDLLSRPTPGGATPQVRGFTQRSGWSEEPIRLAALLGVDADVKLKLAQVVYQDFTVGRSRVSMTLTGGILKAVFEDVALYEGRGRGAVTVDATSAVPRFGASIAADGISLLPLLKDAGAKSWIAGAAKINIAVTGEGGTQKAMMDGLAGKADIGVANGAIVGWNLAQILRGLKQGQLSGLDRVETAKTDFSELASTWIIAEGVAQNQDLKLNSPLMRVTGAGRVDLGKRQIDFQLKPKLVASLEGQGAAQGLGGLEIPLRVRGPWERPQIAPEVGDLLKDPDKALGAAKEIGKQFKGKSANEIVDQVLGDNPGAAKKANDFLNKLLKPK